MGKRTPRRHRMFTRRHWIPPLGLAFGQLCHGLSWILALWIALRVGITSLSLPEIAWIHLVALGWVTVTALSVLLHAIPAFLDVPWRYETLARYALFATAVAIAAFIIALLWAPLTLGVVATLIACALMTYLVTAWATLWQAVHSADRIDRAVAGAFAVTLAIFAIAVILGAAISWMAAGARVPASIARLPPAHANLALFGWLTLLIYGVSARTLRPLTGNRSRRPSLHIVVGNTMLLGAPLLAIGSAAEWSWALWLGGALVAAGAGVYIGDVTDRLMRATVPHRVPQAFIAAGLTWLAISMLLGAGVLAGMPWPAAFGFVLIAGWIGQFVNAHIFHIGVRLIATIYRGEDDETAPQELLDPRWTWCAFATMQIAVALVGAGLVSSYAPSVAVGSVAGLIGWVSMVTALAKSRVCAQQ